MEHGLDIRDGSHAEEYISKYGLPDQNKWGLPEEITKGHMKKAVTVVLLLLTSYSYLLKINRYTVANCLLNYSKNLLFQLKVLLSLFGGVVLKTALYWRKTDQELAEETEKNAIELTSVANYGFTLFDYFPKKTRLF